MLPAIVQLEPEIDLHKGPPLRPLRLPDQMHPGFMRRPVRLDRIALDTRANDVFPCGWSSPVTGDDMIQVQVLAIKLVTAVLAGVLVPLEDVVPGKLDLFLRQAVK